MNAANIKTKLVSWVKFVLMCRVIKGIDPGSSGPHSSGRPYNFFNRLYCFAELCLSLLI